MVRLIGMMLVAAGIALLNKVIKEGMNSIKSSEPKGQIIEIEDYEVLDENTNPTSKGYKVIVQ